MTRTISINSDTFNELFGYISDTGLPEDYRRDFGRYKAAKAALDTYYAERDIRLYSRREDICQIDPDDAKELDRLIYEFYAAAANLTLKTPPSFSCLRKLAQEAAILGAARQVNPDGITNAPEANLSLAVSRGLTELIEGLGNAVGWGVSLDQKDAA